MALPPEIVENRSDEREVFRLINALRRQVGGTSADAAYWLSTPHAELPSAVDMGALASGILRHTVALGVSTPGVVTVGTGLTYVSPTLSLADTAVTPGSYTYASITVDQQGRLTSAGSGTTPAPVDATYWTSSSNATLTGEVNLGALGNGTLQQTVTLGVSTPTAFAGTTGSIPFYAANSQLAQDNANLFWDNTNKRLGIGTAAPGFAIEVVTNANAARGFKVSNTNAGTSAQVQNQLANDVGSLSYYGIASSTFAGFAPLNSGQAFVGSNATHFSIFTQSAHDVVLSTTAIERMRIAAGGNVSIANLSAGGVVYATAATAVLKIGTSAEVAAAITWPAAKVIIYSSGVSTAPTGNAAFLFDTGGNVVELGAGIEQAWYNLGSLGTGNYERVRARWSSNVFELLSEKGGTGTVRAMKINSDTANLTLQGALLTGTVDHFAITASGTTGSTLYGDNSSGVLTIDNWLGILIDGNASVDVQVPAIGGIGLSATRIDYNSGPVVASGAAVVLDSHRFRGNATITGTTTITVPFALVSVSQVTFAQSGAGAVTVDNPVSFYIAAQPLAGTDVTFTQAYAMWVDQGLSRFDGNGTNVFELPADTTANATGTVGRIPVLIGGTTRYLRYYAD